MKQKMHDKQWFVQNLEIKDKLQAILQLIHFLLLHSRIKITVQRIPCYIFKMFNQDLYL